MNEADWMTGTKPGKMLESLRGRASDRKLRLFGVACCRRIGDLITDERSRFALDATERFAEGDMDREELSVVAADAGKVETGDRVNYPARAAAAIAGVPWYPSHDPLECTDVAARRVRWVARDYGVEGEPAAQCSLLRCVFGNPYRPVTLHPSWLTPSVVSLAQAAYEHRELPAGI